VGDIGALYRSSDIVVHPARWEGFGLAMLEGMLAAKPVVAARAGSAPELVVDGETGALVPPDDPEALATAISTVLANPRGLGTAGLARARAEFSVEQMAAGTLGVYERVSARS
jgi:glycosyltransferase involved in cell wall biosynthesis